MEEELERPRARFIFARKGMAEVLSYSRMWIVGLKEMIGLLCPQVVFSSYERLNGGGIERRSGVVRMLPSTVYSKLDMRLSM